MRYAKFISENKIEHAPKVFFEGDVYIANPTEDLILEHGYKPLVVDEAPETGENEYLVPSYTETDNEVHQHWNVEVYEEGGE